MVAGGAEVGAIIFVGGCSSRGFSEIGGDPPACVIIAEKYYVNGGVKSNKSEM